MRRSLVAGLLTLGLCGLARGQTPRNVERVLAARQMSGVVGLFSMLSMILIGTWFIRTKIFPGFGTYSFVTVGVVVLSTGFYIVTMGSPIMGLAERITILIGFMWTFILSYWMYSKRGMQMENHKKSESENIK